jgi:hypothetical protein
MDAAQVGHAADSDDSCEIRVSAWRAYQSFAVIALGKGEVESSILSAAPPIHLNYRRFSPLNRFARRRDGLKDLLAPFRKPPLRKLRAIA